MQIRNKLTLQFLIIVAVMLGGSLISVYYLSARYREGAFYGRLKDKAITSVELLKKIEKRDSTLMAVIDRANKDVLYQENIFIYDDLDQQIYTKNDTSYFEMPLSRVYQIRLQNEKRFHEGEFDVIGLRYIDKMNNQFIVFAGAIDRPGLNELNNLRSTLLIVFFSITIAATVLGWLFAQRALSPILKVIDQVDNISASNLSKRLDEGNRRDEIARLAATFNKMLNRIESAFKIQKTFVANASHELRNMLTVITSQLEVILMKERSAEEYRQTLTTVMEDIKNLNEVSNRLLELAKVSSEEVNIHPEKIRIDELLWELKEEVLKRHPQNKVNFIINELPEDDELLNIQGNEPLLKTAFINLMENACKFSPKHEVFVTLAVNEYNATIRFSDNGIGISEEELPFIFEPFYRGKNTMSVRGHGIGLSLVARILRLHNALIHVNSKLGEGTTFVVIFPYK
jgi:signal transduction histidine kinase